MPNKQYRMAVFDRPVVKDWAFWHGIGWSLAVGVSVLFDPDETSTAPLWVDVLGIGAVTFFMIGWPVAAVRRLVRELRQRRRPWAAPNVTPVQVPENRTPAAGPQESAPGSLPPPARTPIPAPVAFSSYAGSDLRASETLTRARAELPYPVARAARAAQMTQDPLEQYQYLLDLGEHLTLTLGMLSASWLRQHAPNEPSLRTLYDAYMTRGVSQGHWHEVTKAAERVMAKSGGGIPGFVEGIRDRRGSPGAIQALKPVLMERNKAAHGARPHNRPEAAMRNNDLAPQVVAAVDRAMFLSETPWVLVESVGYRRQDHRWNVRLRRAMGDHPDFDATTQVLDLPLANDTFYVLNGSNPLDLTPMLVMRYCDQCRQPEVCHADKVNEHGVALKSFARGHEVFDPGLVDEVRALIPDAAGGSEHPGA